MSFPGTQSPHSTPTPMPTAPGPTQIQTQNVTNDNANTIGNNMHLPPTPPADDSPPKSASNTNKRGGGEQTPGSTGSATAVGKFGSAMLHLPSFASVLSSPSPSHSHPSSSSSASGTKSLLAPTTAMTAIHSRSSAMAKATSVQQQQQTQEQHKREHGQGQAQSSSSPLALLSPNVSMATDTASPSPASSSSVTNRDDLDRNVSRSAAAYSSALSPSRSPCSSHSNYQSPLGSPRLGPPAADLIFSAKCRHDNNTANADSGNTHRSQRTSSDGEAQDPVDDSESSDVEIYLNHDSASRMHVHVLQGDSNGASGKRPQGSSQGQRQATNESPTGTYFPAQEGLMPPPTASGLGASRSNDGPTSPTATTTPKRLSPLPPSLPVANNLSQQPHSKMKGTSAGQAKSPQIPPHAPVHNTIPLPEADACEHEYQQYQQQQQQHQQVLALQTQSHPLIHASSSSTIDLTGLAAGHTQQQQQGHSITASQSLPATTDFTPSSAVGLSGSIHNPHAARNSNVNVNAHGLGFASSVSEMTLQGQKTPNVYINGLPPHFPEDQLFALAAPFGDIRSVRTFTRHVRDSESGYGFVLFETIEAAEKCIISLRRYRNLHPTFSKQIHKIPGTAYASIPPPGSSVSSWDGQSSAEDAEGASASCPDGSFKAKMESLHDPSSTNLYMEGLPLSIDEPTLSALVTPHRISSSRFFQTRLSNPPRIIAFVRLETRAGAEEIIERLHGRMVRGWNDSGSRISVRFADTSEQRELRRTERSTQEGEVSPARLTIAQAALLNLRGQDLRPPKSGPVIHAHSAVPDPIGRLPSAASSGGFSTSVSAPDFSSNASQYHHPPPNISGGGLEVDYSLAPGQGAMSGHSSRNRSPAGYSYQALPDPYQTAPVSAHASSSMDPAMCALLNSLQGNEMPYNAASDYPQTLRNPGFNQAVGGRLQGLPASQSMGSTGYPRPAPAFTRSGYTATEEYIMRAHAESTAWAQAQVQHQQFQQQAAERRRPAPLDLRRGRGEDQDFDGNGQEENGANIAVGVRGYRAQASIGRVGQGQGFMSPPASSVSMPSLASLAAASPMMGGMSSSMSLSEDDFHASAAAVRQQFRSGGDDWEGGVGNSGQRGHIQPAYVHARFPGDPGSAGLPSQTQTQYQSQIQRPLPLSPLMPSLNEDLNSNSNSSGDGPMNYRQAHMRSTTLPQHRSSAGQAQENQSQTQHVRGHYQHSSMSIPAPSLRTPQHASASVMSGRTLDASGMGDGAIYEGEQQEQQGAAAGGCLHGAQLSSNAHHHTHARANAQQQIQNYGQQQNHYSPGIFGDVDSASGSPSLISPTLTYSSQTSSTLSPATPFFGSFNSQTEGFERVGMEQGQGLKKGSPLRSAMHTQTQTQTQAQ